MGLDLAEPNHIFQTKMSKQTKQTHQRSSKSDVMIYEPSPAAAAAAAAADERATSALITSEVISEPYIDLEDRMAIREGLIEHIPSDKKNFRLRNWFITYWCRVKEGQTEPQMLQPAHSNIAYYVTQIEVCPGTRKIHGHMYLELLQPVTRAWLCKLFDVQSRDIWTAARRGSPEAAIAYCSKEDTRHPDFEPYFYGTSKRQGFRSDLDQMAQSTFDGLTKAQMVAAYGGNALRHIGMIDKLQRSLNGADSIDNYVTLKRKAWLEHCEQCERRGDEPPPFHRFKYAPYDPKMVKEAYTADIHDECMDMVDEFKEKKEAEDELDREARHQQALLPLSDLPVEEDQPKLLYNKAVKALKMLKDAKMPEHPDTDAEIYLLRQAAHHNDDDDDEMPELC